MSDTKIQNGIPDAESTPSTLEEIENNWINEHARQVFPILLLSLLNNIN